MALNNLLCHIRAFSWWNETWLWIRGKKKILTDSSNSFWIARTFLLPGRLAVMYIHPQNPESQIQSIRWTRRQEYLGSWKPKRSGVKIITCPMWLSAAAVCYLTLLSLQTWFPLPQLAGEARNTVLESHSTCSRQAGGRFKVESRNCSFM